MGLISVALLSLAAATSINARALSERPSSSLQDCRADPSLVVQKQVFASVDGQSLTATTYACAEGDSTSFEPRALPLDSLLVRTLRFALELVFKAAMCSGPMFRTVQS